jgi:hypothetical protein
MRKIETLSELFYFTRSEEIERKLISGKFFRLRTIYLNKDHLEHPLFIATHAVLVIS